MCIVPSNGIHRRTTPHDNFASAVGLNWQGVPVHPSNERDASSARSTAKLRAAQGGRIDAVTLGGKTLITTASIVAFLAKAQPWGPDRDRVARAVAGAARRGAQGGKGSGCARAPKTPKRQPPKRACLNSNRRRSARPAAKGAFAQTVQEQRTKRAYRPFPHFSPVPSGDPLETGDRP